MSESSTPPTACREWLPLASILVVAAALRLWNLNHWSLWYDEVVTMRLARAPGIPAMLRLLDQTDATRAPLHPLILMGWIRVFGSSDLAARMLSAFLGWLTVAAVYGLARSAFGISTARWSAWLCAVCPTLVYYSQEVRMYSQLVLLTVVSWWIFLSFRTRARPLAVAGYGLTLAALVYTQPLGLFMVGAHGLVYLVCWRGVRLSLLQWLTAMAIAVAAIVPWLPRYLDHSPDYPLPRYGLRFLVGVPIEYIGGNALTLVPLAALIFWGVIAWRRRTDLPSSRVEIITVAGWFALPVLFLYIYSWVAHPIFGPSRYNLFVAPAYLVLVGRGLAALPTRWRVLVAILLLSLTVNALIRVTYAPGIKADWRRLAHWIDAHSSQSATVIVEPHTRLFPRTQFEAARYYLEPRHRVVLDEGGTINSSGARYRVHCVGQETERARIREPVVARFHGLLVTRQ